MTLDTIHPHTTETVWADEPDETCPDCGSEDIDKMDVVTVLPNAQRQRYDCWGCGLSWKRVVTDTEN